VFSFKTYILCVPGAVRGRVCMCVHMCAVCVCFLKTLTFCAHGGHAPCMAMMAAGRRPWLQCNAKANATARSIAALAYCALRPPARRYGAYTYTYTVPRTTCYLLLTTYMCYFLNLKLISISYTSRRTPLPPTPGQI
jgi:hypothetical protein